jgi:hypothetical protein
LIGVSGTESAAAEAIRRGTMRLLQDLDAPAMAEVMLPTGRRLDLLALDAAGQFVAVEIKSSPADWHADTKWPDYLEWADRFLFAVAPDFPVALLPAAEGLILADRWHAEIVRPALVRPLAAARRRALTLRFARLAAARAMLLADPPLSALPRATPR